MPRLQASRESRPGKTPAKAPARPVQPTSRDDQGWHFIRGFEQHQGVAVDSLQRLLLDPMASIMTWVVLGIALALPTGLYLVLQNLQQFGSNVDQAARISLFMNMGLADARLMELRERLLQQDDIRQVDIISAAAALEEFQTVSGFGEALSGLDENPLPAVLVVTPTSLDGGAGTQERLARLQARLQALPEVDAVQLDRQWLQRLYMLIDLARRLTLGLTILFCTGVILVVGNTVRLTIENRRAEIVVIKLVGGSDAYVARPFLYTGLWYGVGGGLVACLLLLASLVLLQGPVSGLAGLYGSKVVLQGTGISGVLVILAGSGLLGWAGAGISVLRHLRAIEPT
ncbi:MAG: permease-like cell division protein FtsX [Pseudomonadales bacterium]|nr:permease-like cell division protein FtsX [Pseudomonadales bacterium]